MHSLIGSAVWALAASAIAYALAPSGPMRTVAAVLSTRFFSHWLHDPLVHRHDLGLLDDTPNKLGFGLRNYPWIEMPLEVALLLGTLWIYKNRRAQRVPGAGTW